MLITGEVAATFSPSCNVSRMTSPQDNSLTDRNRSSSCYASAEQSAGRLRAGAMYRHDRMDAADMISVEEAAELAHTTQSEIESWIKSHRCIAVFNRCHRYKLPRWQFEPSVWNVLQSLPSALSATDSWQLLVFLETRALVLGGQTPRAALEQGVEAHHILALATAEAH